MTKITEDKINKIISNYKNNNITHLTFSGGGVKSVVYCGVLKYIDQLNLNLQGASGTSAGSIIATLLALGYNGETINDIMINKLKFNEIFDDKIGFIFDTYNFVYKYGIAPNNYLYNLLGDIISEQYDKDITFQELYEKTQFTLVIAVTNYTKKIIEYFKPNSEYQDVSIRLAVKMSTCIPFIFQPIKYNNDSYIDGGLIDNYPLNVFENDCQNDCLETILGFNIKTKEKVEKTTSILSYVMGLIDIHFNCLSNVKNKKYNRIRTVELYTPAIPLRTFNIDETMKNELIKIGYESTKNFFEQLQ